MEYHSCPFFFSMPPPLAHVTNMPTKGREGEEDGLYAALFAVAGPYGPLCVMLDVSPTTFERGAVCSLFGLFGGRVFPEFWVCGQNATRTKVRIRLKELSLIPFISSSSMPVCFYFRSCHNIRSSATSHHLFSKSPAETKKKGSSPFL